MNTVPKYECTFKFKGKNYIVSATSVTKFTNGFWLNKDLQFDVHSNDMYWIPPHKIERIKRVLVPYEGGALG